MERDRTVTVTTVVNQYTSKWKDSLFRPSSL